MSSTQPKGRIRYIIEIFRTSEDVKPEPVINVEVNKKIVSDLTKQSFKNKDSKENKDKKVKENDKKGKDKKGKDKKGKDKKVKKKKDAVIKHFTEEELLTLHPIINIAILPERKFEIRLVIWNGENVPAMDAGGTSDVYVRAWIVTQYKSKVTEYEILSTDIHWANQDGSPNWN